MATAGCYALFFHGGVGPNSGSELFKFVTKWTKKGSSYFGASAADIVAVCEGSQLPERLKTKIEDALLKCAVYNQDARYSIPNYRGFPDDKALFDCYLRSENERLKRTYLERYIVYRLTISLRSGCLDGTLDDPARKQFLDDWCDKVIKDLEDRIYYHEDFSFLSWSRSLTPRFKAESVATKTAGN